MLRSRALTELLDPMTAFPECLEQFSYQHVMRNEVSLHFLKDVCGLFSIFLLTYFHLKITEKDHIIISLRVLNPQI